MVELPPEGGTTYGGTRQRLVAHKARIKRFTICFVCGIWLAFRSRKSRSVCGAAGAVPGARTGYSLNRSRFATSSAYHLGHQVVVNLKSQIATSTSHLKLKAVRGWVRRALRRWDGRCAGRCSARGREGIRKWCRPVRWFRHRAGRSSGENGTSQAAA